jgi:hypothetical protein
MFACGLKTCVPLTQVPDTQNATLQTGGI